MGRRRDGLAAWMAIAAVLSGCGGGGESSSPTAMASGGTPATTAGTCSLRARQDWAAAQLNEWYLFPETLPYALDPGGYATVDAYLDALTATARSQRRDRYFTYLTSIQAENAYLDAGETAGFGFRLQFDGNSRLFVSESFEGTPALAAGIDRGAEIVAIGTSTATLRSVSDLLAAQGGDGVSAALGPNTAGTTRVLRVVADGETRDVAVAKADFQIAPVSDRYGARILTDGGDLVGYVNLRTFISTADDALRRAFASFRAAGITKVVVDLRYNGGGLVSTALLMARLMGANRGTGEVLEYTNYRPSKAGSNTVSYWAPQPQSIAPTRIAFIGTGGSASASELVINAFIPFLGSSAGLIGANTFGKPVGQIARDNAACDDRLRVVAFAGQNAARQGEYYDGLASKVAASCRASDELRYPLGDPREASLAAALAFLRGESCTPISGSGAAARALSAPAELLIPPRPDTAQREVPGLF